MTRAAAQLAAIAAAAACLLAVPACGGHQRAPQSAGDSQEPHWQDLFDDIPELYIVVRPRRLRQDPVFGPLLSRAIEAGRERSRVVAATRALDAVDDAEEIIVGVGADSPGHPGDLVLVARGVRADLDPGKLVDTEGRAVWEPGPSGPVRELVCERDSPDGPGPAGTPSVLARSTKSTTEVGASLFELPGRTWVIASGGARARARDVFAHPVNRPTLHFDPDALAVVRVDGPSLVQRIRPLQETAALGDVGRRLQSVTFALPAGGDGQVRATLAYADEDAAAFAESTVRGALGAIGRTKPERLAWLAAASVERPGKRVVLAVPLPRQLAEALLRAPGPRDPTSPAPSRPSRPSRP